MSLLLACTCSYERRIGDQLESRMCTLTKKNVLLQEVVALISCILIIELRKMKAGGIFLLAKKWGQRAKKECYTEGSVSNPFLCHICLAKSYCAVF